MSAWALALAFAFTSASALAAGHASLNVCDFGAVGDGVHDDTLAIQKAADAMFPGGIDSNHYVRTMRNRHLDGIPDGANGEVFFPKGTYRVTGPVVFNYSVNVRGEAGAKIRNDAKDSPTFYFQRGFRVRIDDLSFEGGGEHVNHWARNSTDASLFISRCRFSGASGTALVSRGYREIAPNEDKDLEKYRSLAPYVVERYADGRAKLTDSHAGKKVGWFWNSTLITVENCRFEMNKMAFDLASDCMNVRDSVVVADASEEGPAAYGSTGVNLENVRFELKGRKVGPNRCAIECGGYGLTRCSFFSEAPVPAVKSRTRGCTGVCASTLRLIDTTLANCGAPLVDFVDHSFPNMVVVDGLKPAAPAARRQRIFRFDRKPTEEDLAIWQRDGTKDKSSTLPPMDYARLFGVSLANVDETAFDATLPSALAKLVQDAPPGGRVRCEERVTYDFPFAGAKVFTDDAIGAPKYNVDQDDTARLQALFDMAAKAKVAEVILPAAWIRIALPICIRGKVAVRVRGRAVVAGPDDAPLFRVSEGSEVLFENIMFHYGANAVSCGGKNGKAWFRNCYFYDQFGPSVIAGLRRGEAAGWRIELNGGTIDTARLFSGAASPFLMDGVWLTLTPDRPWKRHRPSYVCIENFERGMFIAKSICGVPRYFENNEVFVKTPGKIGDFRWIDNYGKLLAYNFRFGGERRGITPVYAYPDASTYVEGGVSYHKNNGHLRTGSSAAGMSSEKDDLKFVDVAGFNFTESPSFHVGVQNPSGGYDRRTTGFVYNCTPYPSPERKDKAK